MTHKIGLTLIFSLFQLVLVPVLNANNSKIIGSGGVTQVEGAAGGGIVPWAVIASYAQADEWGATLSKTHLTTDDLSFDMNAVAIGIKNRLEFSFAKQKLGLGPLQQTLGLPSNQLKQSIIGFKAKLLGDVIYSELPQLSVGVQYKKNHSFDIAAIAGAKDDSDFDYYLAASKLWIDGLNGYPLLLNLTARSTRANQLGLLGFSGDLNGSRELQLELNASVFLQRNWVVGLEFRQKPSNLAFAVEENWQDLYVAWFYNKKIAGVVSWVDLGSVASLAPQRGIYFSLQANF